jgi:preprotein translocase subunit SecD
MTKNLRWKFAAIVAVIALSAWVVYPVDQTLRLGLDLKGGVHLVLRVHTDEALKAESETAMERMRAELAKAGAPGVTAALLDVASFELRGVPADQAALVRQLGAEIENTYNRDSSGGVHRFTMKPNVRYQLADETVRQAIRTIENRVNELGVAEPIVARHGEVDQILVQLPGVADVERAKEIMGSPALLELKLVDAGPAASREELLAPHGGQEPPGQQVLSGVADGTAGVSYYLVQRTPVITGRDLRNARPTLDEYNQPAVSFSLKPDGAAKFGNATGQNVGRALAIILDGRVFSAPRIESRITDEGRISGSFTQQEAQDLVLTLRSGALPASLTYLEERTVGPSLGADSVRAGITASLVGLSLVSFFMLVFYRLSGINAIVSKAMNLVILLALMVYFGATMTLPGIAGFILTIGIGVDSNVLIFERIKEEMAAQKGVRAAVANGFDRVFLTILDTHVASLIAAAFLFQFGTGPIRGFATTLTIGLLANVFTAVFVSRALFEAVLAVRQTDRLSI